MFDLEIFDDDDFVLLSVLYYICNDCTRQFKKNNIQFLGNYQAFPMKEKTLNMFSTTTNTPQYFSRPNTLISIYPNIVVTNLILFEQQCVRIWTTIRFRIINWRLDCAKALNIVMRNSSVPIEYVSMIFTSSMCYRWVDSSKNVKFIHKKFRQNVNVLRK